MLEDDTVELIYTVVEIWRIWPAVAPIYSEDQGWSIIGAVRFMNFRGRNQSLFAARAVGEEEGYFIFFEDPWIAGDHISFSLGGASESSTHPFLPYNQVLDMIGIGIGMWLGIIMAYNVWMIIWPNQKIALGIVSAGDDEKPIAARKAMLFSRTNTALSIPMLYAMVSAQNLY